VIRFSAFLVAVAVGLLVAGVVTSKLLLVYIAIGVSGVALLALGVGAAVNWRELTGKPGTAHPETAEPGTLEPSAQGPASQAVVAEPVTSSAAASQPSAAAAGAAAAGAPAATGSGWPATAPSARPGPSRAGYLPVSEPPWARTGPAPTSAPAPAGAQAPAATSASRPADAPLAPAAFTPSPRGPGARCLGVARRFDPGPIGPGPGLRRPRGPRASQARPSQVHKSTARPSQVRGAAASCGVGIRHAGIHASGLPEAHRVGCACHVSSPDPEARPVPRRTRACR
jgi:hypothetical protein